jgi:hypothetical protein
VNYPIIIRTHFKSKHTREQRAWRAAICQAERAERSVAGFRAKRWLSKVQAVRGVSTASVLGI